MKKVTLEVEWKIHGPFRELRIKKSWIYLSFINKGNPNTNYEDGKYQWHIVINNLKKNGYGITKTLRSAKLKVEQLIGVK